jgi:hypothetical protein
VVAPAFTTDSHNCNDLHTIPTPPSQFTCHDRYSRAMDPVESQDKGSLHHSSSPIHDVDPPGEAIADGLCESDEQLEGD